MQKLIPRGQLQSFDPSTIELVSPFFATSIVESHLSATSNLFGLSELIRECGVLANTTRTLIQQWVVLNDFEEHRIADSAIRRYGELRRTPQRFLEGEDKWQVGGKSWHWQPVTPDEAYETKSGTT